VQQQVVPSRGGLDSLHPLLAHSLVDMGVTSPAPVQVKGGGCVWVVGAGVGGGGWGKDGWCDVDAYEHCA
jgi:hypothetical protein